MSHAKALVSDLIDFIDNSPSPWHAVSSAVALLEADGFEQLEESEAWQLAEKGRYYVVRDQSSLIAFINGATPPTEAGFRIIGAHSDSPGLRVKPHPISEKGGWLRVGVEVYGGPILATFADRDLSLAGRVSINSGEAVTDIESRLIKFDHPLLRLPNLAIHLNREVNEKGLKFNRQQELPLIFSLADNDNPKNNPRVLQQLLADVLEVDFEQILGWELAIYDTQKGAFWGKDELFFANSQLDNLASCHAALLALLHNLEHDHTTTQVIAFFDHEEVGSESEKGADGSFLGDILKRICIAQGLSTEHYLRALSQSTLMSADMAHAWHPNFADKHDAEHRPMINSGPVLKINSNQRYTTQANTEALFVKLCQQQAIPYQKFINRTDLSCGSTIGPLTASKLGLSSFDVGNPMWSMHSIRESAGVLDHEYMLKLMRAFLLS